MNQGDKFIIKGLGGKKALRGEAKIKGAKNAILKAMAASILFDGPVKLENISETADVEKMRDLLVGLGAHVDEGKQNRARTRGGEYLVEESGVNRQSEGDLRARLARARGIFQQKNIRAPEPVGSRSSVVIDSSNLISTDLDADISQSMRSSIVATGPILARYGKVSFPAPGGCVIGERPVDLFLEAYKKLGAEVVEKAGAFHITVSAGGLKGAEFFFPMITVTGTETLMMTAVLAKGTTTLRNCAMEPEIESLAAWLNSCGAEIKGAGTTTITIHGGKLLKAKKPYLAISDRIETGSFLFLGALCADDLLISKCEPRHVEAVTDFLVKAGVPLEIGKDFIHIKGNGKLKNPSFKGASIRTHEYPGFPTDLQPIAAVFLSQASGESVVFETIFEGRFKYIDDLAKLGAKIKILNGREILVQGPTLYKALPPGLELTAHDIRAGFAVILAALCAEGTSVVDGVKLVDRGYEALEKTLQSLGADIQRVKAENPIEVEEG